MNPQIRIYVISLPRSIERRRRTAARLAALGLDGEFVNATDRAEPVAAFPSGAPGLSAREAACLDSHIRVLTRIANAREPLACIIEDDCDLETNFAHVLEAIAGRPTSRWDVLLLGHHSARRNPIDGAVTCVRGRAIIAGYREARVAECPMGAYAYVVTTAGARALLRHAEPRRMPADWVTGYCEAAGARLFAISPPCVRPLPESEAPSTIDDRGPRAGRAPAAVGARPRTLRGVAGLAWLLARRLGIRPGSYARRL